MLKKTVKSLLRVAAVIAVAPLVLTHFLAGSLSDFNSSLESHSQLLSLIPGKLGNYLRVAFYRFTLEHCDLTATISFGTLLSKTGARIGKHVYIGPYCMLGLVTLEDDVLLGPSVQIPSGPYTHGFEQLDTPIRLQPGTQRRVRIARGCWIGANCVILADVEEQSVVAAGSVSTKKLDSFTVNAGIPARQIKSRRIQ